ncbi:MAG: PEP-CTERM sorting domain-containing protein [Planctomycetaceae bacterium]|nr:PEP-CTERM sorting domain-containing protein [Planctomycetaceae bacterium]
MSRVLPLWISAVFLIASQALATPVITVGDHLLQPNQANQAVTISVTGTEYVHGVNLYLQVGDGTAGPTIQSWDILTGTIFAGATPGQFDNRASSWTILTDTYVSNPNGVLGNGLLATVYIDTTGFTSGTWAFAADFNYEGSQNTTDFVGDPATIVNGSIGVVPEPASFALLCVAAVGLLVWQRARRKS